MAILLMFRCSASPRHSCSCWGTRLRKPILCVVNLLLTLLVLRYCQPISQCLHLGGTAAQVELARDTCAVLESTAASLTQVYWVPHFQVAPVSPSASVPARLLDCTAAVGLMWFPYIPTWWAVAWPGGCCYYAACLSFLRNRLLSAHSCLGFGC